MKCIVKRSVAVNPFSIQKADELATVEANKIQVFTLCSRINVSRACAL